jgi:hypothetical protein
LRKIILFVFVAAFLTGWNPSAEGFHEGGAGVCGGCHGKGRSERQLLGSDPSSTCLRCHSGHGSPQSHNVATPDGSAMSPGGDFYWLKKNFTWRGGSSSGDGHGHNVVARDFGFQGDSRLPRAPGGLYPSSGLGCTSCHDPHGKQGTSVSGSYGPPGNSAAVPGNYRLLGGIGYTGGKQGKGVPFKYDAPIARQSSTRKFGENDTSHVDYGSGMSEWCRNCHENIHGGRSLFPHPAGVPFNVSMADNYNRYVKTGDLSGNAAASYLALVPFERGVSDPGRLDPISTRGPDANSRVMCLSCHRAHASAFRAIGRWDFDAQTIAKSHPATGDGGVSGTDVLHSYYGRNMVLNFTSAQESLCGKCHKP